MASSVRERLASAPFRFGYGSRVLDLGVTLRRRASAAVELLSTPADAARWLVASGLLPDEPRLNDTDLAELRALRDAIYRIGNAAVHEQPPSAADVRTLNAAARRADVAPQLGEDWSISAPRSRAFEGALAALARDAIALFADGDRRLLLRTCEHDDCQGLFLDRSR
ncbi:MAG: CGNR zinc finger domain-containing protein, partial [Vulcanimicrobiaceae bacterium]